MSVAVEKLLYNVKEVAQAMGLSERDIWRRVSKNEFPAPISLGSKCARWSVKDLRKWIDSQPRANDSANSDEDNIL